MQMTKKGTKNINLAVGQREGIVIVSTKESRKVILMFLWSKLISKG